MNPIAAQNPEEIPGPLIYITLRRADYLTDCPLTDAFEEGFPDPFSSMPLITTLRPSTQANRMFGRRLSGSRAERLLAVSGGREPIVKKQKRPYSRLSVKRRGGKCKCLCDSLSSLRVIMEVGMSIRDFAVVQILRFRVEP